MRKIQRTIFAMFILFVLILQISGFLILNSVPKSAGHSHQTSMSRFMNVPDMPGQFIIPYYWLQIGLILIAFLCLLGVISGAHFFKDAIRPTRLPELFKRTIAQTTGRIFSTQEVEGTVNSEVKDVAHVFAIMCDVIARREKKINQLAYWDTLTELPNRIQFIELLKQAIAANNEAATLDSQPNFCFVLMMDLARFKNVNDIMGHSFGDLLLKKVAERLRDAMPGSQLARLGGDEFALLISDADFDSARDAALIMLLTLEKPIVIGEQAIDLGAGIGIAGYPVHGENAELIMSRAEVAMYDAKRSMGSNFTMYCPEIDLGSQQNLSLISELRNAILENQLQLFIQPKLDLRNEIIVGAESLIRWNHPTRGFLFPDKFILFAEQTGVIRMLTKWMLEKSALFSKELTAHGIDLKISVNISTHDLLDPELPRKISELLNAHDVKSSSFCLEITESAIMNDPARAQITLERLSAMGVELSIDDFGTGYSSLSYLKRLPVNELKIDKSFVMQMSRDEDDKTIVRSTIELGHNMGLRVVAEGVEIPAVLHLLRMMKCDQVQGNFINQPIPADQFIEWLKLQNKTTTSFFPRYALNQF